MISHNVIYNHLLVAAPKQRADTIEQLRDALVHMAHSREGAYAGLECVWHGTAKDRKAIIKSFKTFMLKTAQVSVCFHFSIFIIDFFLKYLRTFVLTLSRHMSRSHPSISVKDIFISNSSVPTVVLSEPFHFPTFSLFAMSKYNDS